jgi:hypothetical protein
LSDPRDEPTPPAPSSNWRSAIEGGIVFGVTALSVLGLAYLLLGAARDHALSVWGALAVAGVAGVAAARTPKVRAAIIGVLSFLQNISQLWR